MMRYDWKPGRTFSIAAQAVGEELERIEVTNGRLTPHAVVDRARPEGSLLHPFFEWDDVKAAEHYRHDQARSLIQCVVVKSIDGVEPPQTVRAFVNLSTDDGREYQGIARVLSDDEKRKRLLAEAKAELEKWRLRYVGLKEFSVVFAAIDHLEPA